MEDRFQVRIIIYGRVQGVSFRHTLRREAMKHGVSGWVKNHFDGSVEALFQGSRDELVHMIEWSREGPSRAQVTNIDISWERPETTYNMFEIQVWKKGGPGL